MKHCDEVDWSTAKVYEKFDGDLCVLFHHKGSWLVSSNGMSPSEEVRGER